MNRTVRPHHIVLIILLAAVVVTGMQVESVWTQRNYEFIPEMVTSVPVDAQSARRADLMTMRGENAAPGTVHSADTVSGTRNPYVGLAASEGGTNGGEVMVAGAMAVDVKAAEAIAADVGAAEASRIELLRRAEARGQDMYAVFCSPCHGTGGAGDGVVSKRGYPPPPSLLADNARALSDTALYRIIAAGQGNMPGYASQLRPIDRWNLVLSLRAMQGAQQPTGGGTP